MNDFSTILLSDYSILSSDLSKIDFNSKCVINTVNQYSFILAENDQEFKSALSHSDVLLPDGVGIVAAVKLLTGNIIKKIAGADMHQHLLTKLNTEGGKCFYLGSTDATLSLIKKKINLEYPNIKVETYSPPFKPAFLQEDNDKIIAAVNSFKPDVLFVGMTAPKQEKWTYQFQSQLDVPTICSIGAVFDFYAGTVSRPSIFWQNLGLEWFVRLLKEPRRMFKRYVYYGPVFVLLILKRKTKKLMFPRISSLATAS
jgi:N-acetylglucosaminyldiphosphoundecaprenol N-acetyl-beta-D-mannosaminyltransferase